MGHFFIVKTFEQVNDDIESMLLKAYQNRVNNKDISKIENELKKNKIAKKDGDSSKAKYAFNERLLKFAFLFDQKDTKENNFLIFISTLAVRVRAFEEAYQSKINDRREILEQYQRFAHTLKKLLNKKEEKENRITSLIRDYLNRQQYYPVGPTTEIPKSGKSKLMAYSAISAGLGLLALGVAAIFFCWPVTAAVIPLALLIMAPAVAYLLSPNELNSDAVKNEEIALFECCANLSKDEETQAYEYPKKLIDNKPDGEEEFHGGYNTKSKTA